jgi:hypothetical protein
LPQTILDIVADVGQESREPSFLRKLKSQYGGDQDRHERPIARPRKDRADDEDEGPTYVDEASNDTISKEDYEKMINPESATQAEISPLPPRRERR